MTSPSEKRLRLWLNDREQSLTIRGAERADSFHVEVEHGGVSHRRDLRLLRGSPLPIALVDGRVLRLAVFEQAGERRVSSGGDSHRVRVGENNPAAEARRAAAAPGLLLAPMPGRVVAIRANVGDAVEKGSLLVVIEAMKMQNELFSGTPGTVLEVLVTAGDTVERGAALIRVG